MSPVHVTVQVWQVPPRRLPAVLWRMAVDRRRLRRLPGVSFAKLLGTGRGFVPWRPDPSRWLALMVWTDLERAAAFDATRPARAWRALAARSCRLDLRPLASRGTWAGREPFHQPRPPAPDADPTAGRGGTVLALTRARLRAGRAVAFWRAVGPPSAAVRDAPGLLATFGIGEAPIGWQGTVSLWRDASDLVEFAYRHPDHRRVIDLTPARRWYAEELFARFAVVAVTGDRGVLGWRGEDGATDTEEDGPVRR